MNIDDLDKIIELRKLHREVSSFIKGYSHTIAGSYELNLGTAWGDSTLKIPPLHRNNDEELGDVEKRVFADKVIEALEDLKSDYENLMRDLGVEVDNG